MRKPTAYLAAFAILTSLAACFPASVVVPKISYKTTSEVKTGQPDCTAPIMDALNDVSREPMIEAFWCYDRVIQYWQDEYGVLEVQIRAVNEGGDK